MSYYEPLFKGLKIEVVGPESQRKAPAIANALELNVDGYY
jgi:hypothetical protein